MNQSIVLPFFCLLGLRGMMGFDDDGWYVSLPPFLFYGTQKIIINDYIIILIIKSDKHFNNNQKTKLK